MPSKNSKKTLKETCENEEATASRAALLKLPTETLERADLQVTKGATQPAPHAVSLLPKPAEILI